METIFVGKINEVKKSKLELEKKLNVKITIVGNKINLVGDAVGEFEAIKVFDAIQFGFPAKKALLLNQEDFVFRKIHIRDYTKRNLRDIQARLIGTRGKTKRTISEITGCEILIKEGEVGIIGYFEDVENTSTALINLIKGSKQSNMYKYLEKMNKRDDNFDLGLK